MEEGGRGARTQSHVGARSGEGGLVRGLGRADRVDCGGKPLSALSAAVRSCQKSTLCLSITPGFTHHERSGGGGELAALALADEGRGRGTLWGPGFGCTGRLYPPIEVVHAAFRARMLAVAKAHYARLAGVG